VTWLDGCSSDVDARRDPRGRDQVAVFDDVLFVDHIDGREPASHLGQGPPVRRGTFAIQQACFPEE
jgi:hypothetical protein